MTAPAFEFSVGDFIQAIFNASVSLKSFESPLKDHKAEMWDSFDKGREAGFQKDWRGVCRIP
jgi:hypothetical protein